MPYPHEFGLRGPWAYEPLGLSELAADGQTVPVVADLPQPGRITMPSSWAGTLGADFRGRVRYTRAFQRPTNLDAREHVWLVLEGVDHFGEVALNGQPLGHWRGYAMPCEFDITGRLADRNQLTVEVELPRDPHGLLVRPGRASLAGGLVGDVRLEVRRGLFLARLAIAGESAEDGSTLEIAGRVGGDPASLLSEDLAITVHLARREILYEPVIPLEEFRFRIPVEGLPLWQAGQPHPLTQAAEVEVALLSDGFALWQCSQRLFGRPPAPVAATNPAALPRPTFADGQPTPDAFRAALGAPLPAQILCEQILSDAHYQAFTEMGLAVVQACPSEWLPAVRARLARHACVAGWH